MDSNILNHFADDFVQTDLQMRIKASESLEEAKTTQEVLKIQRSGVAQSSTSQTRDD